MGIVGAVSRKGLAFLKELENLCEKHSMTLAGCGQEGIQLWDMDDKKEALHFLNIEDMTRRQADES
jgi:hypothetical protein